MYRENKGTRLHNQGRRKVIQDYMIPMRQDIVWGYIIPYMVTGILNEHPRTAIAYRKTKDKDKFAEFYEQM